ncbi:MAG: preprotein translocase subunit YajC [Phycisphaerae bacterium]
MRDFTALIGQATSTPAAGTKPPTPTDPFWGLIVPMGLVMITLYYFMYRGQKKDRDKHDKMLGGLKRNDRVITIGGILGSVVEVRDHEVVLKVDESNNTKMRFARSAIKEVLGGESPADASKK